MAKKPILVGGHTVVYDRSDKLWLVQNDEELTIDTMPSGPAGKRAALIKAIEAERPDVYQLARNTTIKHQTLSNRAWAGAQLLVSGCVQPPSEKVPGEVAQVRSQTDPSTSYSVLRFDSYLCNCHDFVQGHAPQLESSQRYCKHILAVLLSRWVAQQQEVPEYA